MRLIKITGGNENEKLIALLLIMVMVIAATACQAKPEAPKTEEMTEEKTEETMEETTEEAMDKLYIPVMAKGFQHQFWQAVKAGADAAAAEYGVEIYFDGPASETEIDAQVNMVKNEMAKNPKAMALAALSTEAVTEILEECAAKDIPVIGFDSGVPDDKTGAVKATASTNNENAAAIAAEKFGENEVIVEAMKNADSKKPVIIGCLSQDAVSASITGRTTGFVNKMAEIAEMYQPGKVSIEGHANGRRRSPIPLSSSRLRYLPLPRPPRFRLPQTPCWARSPSLSSAPTRAPLPASCPLYPTVRISPRAASTAI